ncbi:unnamed protein product, partial [Prunus brigantina]
MSSHEIRPKSGGVPPNYEILKARTKGCVPDNIGISPLPRGSNMYTGAGIPRGSLILSPAHLEHIRFPLHPLFHMLLFFLDLHPMQLNPNSYLLISGFLAIGLKWGVSLSFKNFIYLHDLACVRGENHYFFFTPGARKKIFTCKPTSTKYWKNHPFLFTGEWAAPEMSNMPIPSAFGPKPGLPSDKRHFIPEDRRAWLEENLANLFKDICSVDVELCCTEDSASRIQASFQEREVELAQHSSSEDCASESESDQSDMSAPRSLSVPGRRERRPGKKPELSGSAKKSRHASQVVLGLGSPNVSAASTPSRPQQIPRAPTSASSLGEDDLTS